eukprot:1158903-Pelagomonas_calceolata.AAC.8
MKLEPVAYRLVSKVSALRPLERRLSRSLHVTFLNVFIVAATSTTYETFPPRKQLKAVACRWCSRSSY